MLDVSMFLKFKMMSSMNVDSWSLFGARDSFDVWMISSKIGISMERGAWSEDNQELGRIECWSSSDEPYHRNMRLITELDSPAVSEYLVGQGLVRVNSARLKESTIIIKSSLIEEWNGKDKSHKLSLMLKSPVIRTMLLMLASVSFRYFKAVCDELE